MIKLRKLVVIFEDNMLDAQKIASSLKQDFDTMLIQRSEELIKQLGSNHTDLLMLSSDLTVDYSLSIMTSTRASSPELPIILMYSGANQRLQVTEHYAKLANASISKPFSTESLLALVRTTLGNTTKGAQVVTETTRNE